MEGGGQLNLNKKRIIQNDKGKKEKVREDPRALRIGFNLAALAMRDKLYKQHLNCCNIWNQNKEGKGEEEEVEGIKGRVRVKIFDFSVGGECEISGLFDGLGIECVEKVTSNHIPLHLSQKDIVSDPSIIVIFYSMIIPPGPKEIFKNLVDFVRDGGLLITFNCAPHILSHVFPGTIQSVPPSTLMKARLKKIDQDLLNGYDDFEMLVFEENRFPMNIVQPSSVTVLAQLALPYNKEPLLVRFPYGEGIVYCASSMLLTDEKTIDDPESFLTEKMNASQTTQLAWKCARDVGFNEGHSLAVSALPLCELIIRLICKEHPSLSQRYPKREEDFDSMRDVDAEKTNG